MIPHDQADELRALARRAQCERETRAAPPQRVTVTSGTAGVGTSTVAIRLSLHLTQQGLRTVLVDAAASRPDATRRCEVEDHPTIADVLLGECGIDDVLRPTTTGLQVVPGAWASSEVASAPPSAHQRLLHEIDSLRPDCDVVVVDAGTGSSRLLRRLWQFADAVVLVTTASETAIMDAYAAIKTMAVDGEQPPIQTVVNQSIDAEMAADAHRRLALASRRFLGVDVGLAAVIPFDAHFGGESLLEFEHGFSAESAAAVGDLAQAVVRMNGTQRTAPAKQLLAVQ